MKFKRFTQFRPKASKGRPLIKLYESRAGDNVRVLLASMTLCGFKAFVNDKDKNPVPVAAFISEDQKTIAFAAMPDGEIALKSGPVSSLADPLLACGAKPGDKFRMEKVPDTMAADSPVKFLFIIRLDQKVQ